MITPAYAQTMAAYNAEMNRRTYAAAARLSDAQRRQDCGSFFKTIHATLNHLLWADRTWMSRFAAWPKPGVNIKGSTTLVDDFATLRVERGETDTAITAWAASLPQSWLNGELTWFSGAMQRDMSMPVAPLVIHMFNHQTHHRGQIHAMLTSFGEDTGDTDLPFIL